MWKWWPVLSLKDHITWDCQIFQTNIVLVTVTRKDKLGMGTASGNLDRMPLSEMEKKTISAFGTRCPKNNHLRPDAQLTLHKQEIVAARSKLWRVCSHEIVLIIRSLMSLMNETIRIKFLLQIYRWAQRTRGKTYENHHLWGADQTSWEEKGRRVGA